MMAVKIVPYYRVSTKRQGESGLGLDGQKEAVKVYVRQVGARVLKEYTEVESGKIADRPQLAAALAHAKRSKAILVVAKLDRLARNVAFLSAIMESGADFVACDNPAANRLTIHILAAVAEHEAEMISQRTKAGLAALKKRGVPLGSARPGHWDGREEVRLKALAKARKLAGAARQQYAAEAYADIRPTMVEMRETGKTLQQIADALNADGHTTRRGKLWVPAQVKRVLDQSNA